MKVSIGMKLKPGPWGGGNQFGWSLSEHLRRKGAGVYFDLKETDLDIVVLTGSKGSAAYTYKDVIKYLMMRNWKALVVYRVNECDERKGTKGVNRRIMRASRCVDHTVFISNWLKKIFARQGFQCRESRVIHNGADATVFNNIGFKGWDGSGRLKLVTHHWGAGWLKGFDIYQRLDEMVSDPVLKEKVQFTFIGNVPEGFRFQNARHVLPKTGTELAGEIKRHHVYITASKNEPAGMHHIEGAMCGLPLLYRESGALPEYCGGYGISFREENFEQKLGEMIETYDHWANQMATYPYTADEMCEEYANMFLELIDRRDKILEQRTLGWKSSSILLAPSLLPAGKAFKWLKGIFGACV